MYRESNKVGRLYHTGASHCVSLLPLPEPVVSRSSLPVPGATTQSTRKTKPAKTARATTAGCGDLPPLGANGPTPAAPCDGSTEFGMRDFILEYTVGDMGKGKDDARVWSTDLKQTTSSFGVFFVFRSLWNLVSTKYVFLGRRWGHKRARHAARVRRVRVGRSRERYHGERDGGHRLRRPGRSPRERRRHRASPSRARRVSLPNKGYPDTTTKGCVATKERAGWDANALGRYVRPYHHARGVPRGACRGACRVACRVAAAPARAGRVSLGRGNPRVGAPGVFGVAAAAIRTTAFAAAVSATASAAVTTTATTTAASTCPGR